MTLQKDLSILTGDPKRAESICHKLFVKGKSQQKAYDQLLEVGRNAELGIVRVTVLLLKYEDERQELIDTSGRDSARNRTKPWSTREFFEAVSSYGEEYQLETRRDLLLLVSELSLLGLNRMSTDSDAIAYIEERRRETVDRLSRSDEETSIRFCDLKLHWLSGNEKLKHTEATLDKLVERAASIRRRFMEIAGPEFLAKRAQACRLEVAERRLQLLKKNPGVNAAEVERMLTKGAGQQDARLARHQLGLPIGCFIRSPTNPSSTGKGYEQARSLLRNLASLTHPDKVRQLDLGWAQRSQLESIWHETSAYRAQSNNKNLLACAVTYLESKLLLAERILALAHIDELDATLVVQGSTIDEQIRWLESANEFLDERLRIIEADNLHIANNFELYYMLALIESPKEAREAGRKSMAKKCEAFRRRADKLEHEAARLLEACA